MGKDCITVGDVPQNGRAIYKAYGSALKGVCMIYGCKYIYI